MHKIKIKNNVYFCFPNHHTFEIIIESSNNFMLETVSKNVMVYLGIKGIRYIAEYKICGWYCEFFGDDTKANQDYYLEAAEYAAREMNVELTLQ